MLGLFAFSWLAVPSFAQSAGSQTYQANLTPVALNRSTGSGTVKLVLNGSSAQITEHVSGLAATFNGSAYPHVQHIHINGQGVCPDASADTSGDGVLSTAEGQPAYGAIGTSLTKSGDTSPAAGTNLQTAPGGASFDYTRTITLDAATLSSLTAGKAVIVVHGLDPATLTPAQAAEKSELVPSLPLAATSPALCGPLAVQAAGTSGQTAVTPTGGVATGGGSTSGVQHRGLLIVGVLLVLTAAGLVAKRSLLGRRAVQ